MSKPESKWRLQVNTPEGIQTTLHLNSSQHPNSVFDELVIDDWFHLEQMDEKDYWMRLGQLTIRIHLGEAGPDVSVCNETTEEEWGPIEADLPLLDENWMPKHIEESEMA